MKKLFVLFGITFVLAAMVPPALPAWADDAAAKPQGKPDAEDEPKEAPPNVPKESEATQKGKPEDKNKSDEKVTGGRFVGDPVYVRLSPMVLPVITDQGAEQLVTLSIAIEVKDFDVADHVHTNMPRVMDALMQALYGGLGQGNLRNGKLLDVNKVKAKATKALGAVIGADNIKDVLIQGVSQRML